MFYAGMARVDRREVLDKIIKRENLPLVLSVPDADDDEALRIIKIVCDYFDISMDAVLGHRKQQEVVSLGGVIEAAPNNWKTALAYLLNHYFLPIVPFISGGVLQTVLLFNGKSVHFNIFLKSGDGDNLTFFNLKKTTTQIFFIIDRIGC